MRNESTTTDAPRSLPVLVDCKPYSARLLEAACVDRWRKAQKVSMSGAGMAHGNAAVRNGAHRIILRECISCPVGKRRAGR